MTHPRQWVSVICEQQSGHWGAVAFTIPETELDFYEWVQEGKSYREWLAHHLDEITRGVLRVTAGVRPPDDGDRPSATEEITQGVRRVRGFGERADENHV